MLNVYRTVYITLDNSKIKLEKINTWSSTKNMRQGTAPTKNSKNKFNYIKIKIFFKESYYKSVRNRQQPNRKIVK